MLNTGKFYWGTIRKAIIAFGNLFKYISIEKHDSDGNLLQTIKVPLSYAPKQKFLAKILQQANSTDAPIQIVIPAMAFEMVGIQYDPNRRISLVQQNRSVTIDRNTLLTQYAPSPYNIEIALYMYAKNQDDALQIIEQILPYFNPDYNLTLKAIPDLDIKNDLPIILNSLTFDEQYEGDFDNRRSIVWTLNFTIKLNFFGPINKGGPIKRVIANMYSDAAMSNSLVNYSVEVNPFTAGPEDSYTFIETFEEF
jgi:hypothetical protein